MIDVKIVLVFFFLTLTWHIDVCAQKNIFPFRNFSQKDGFRTKAIYGITQDKEGFIWAGAADGLYRYDGNTFQHFESPLDTDKNGIGLILCNIYYDELTNRLWLASYSDYQYFDLYTYTFHRLLSEKDASIVAKTTEQNIFRYDTDRMFLSNSNGVFIYSLKNNKLQKANESIAFPSDVNYSFSHFCRLEKNHFALIFPNYIFLVDGSLKIKHVIKAAQEESFVNACFLNSNKKLYVSATNGILEYNLISKSIERHKIPYKTKKGVTLNQIISFVSPFDENTLMVTGMGGFYLFDIYTKVPTRFESSENEFGIPSAPIFHFKDSEGNLWLSSLHQYCSVLYMQNRSLIRSEDIINKKGIFCEPYKTIKYSNQHYVFSGSGFSGIGVIDKDTKKYKVINNPKNAYPFIFGVYKMSNGTLLNFDPLNMNLVDLQHENFTPLLFQIEDKRRSIPSIRSMIELPDQKLFAMNFHEAYILDMKKMTGRRKALKLLVPEFDSADELDAKAGFILNGKLHFYTNSGIYAIDTEKFTAQKMQFPKCIPLNKKLINIRDVIVLNNGNLWIASEKNGIFVFNHKTNQCTNFTVDNSCLKSNLVYSLKEDVYNRIWVGSGEGYLLFDANTFQCMSYVAEAEGLSELAYDFNYFKEDSLMTFNKYPYIIFKDFKKAKFNQANKPTFVTSLKINEEEKVSIPFSKDTSFRLSFSQNNIALLFNNLIHNNAHNNRYKYKLEGLDDVWHISNETKLIFNRLNSGDYTLYLTSANNDGVWSKHMQKIHFHIAPIFYKSWWFILMMVSLVSWLIYTFYKLKFAKLRSEEKMKREFERQISELEMKALRAQMNPHFIFNSLNSIQKFIFEKDEYAASQYLTKFSRLIRLILDQSNQEFVTIGNEIDLLRHYIEMEQLRFKNRFSYTLIRAEDVQEEWLIPSMVVQPHVENAIWHGLMHKQSDCMLKVSIEKLSDVFIRISVEDNGVGREKARELKSKQVLKNKSYGSKISEDRIQHFNRLHGIESIINVVDLIDDQGQAVGTKVIFDLSIKKNSFTQKIGH